MAKIAVFVKNLTSGGAEKQAALLARYLAPDHDVTFIIFNAEKVHEKYLALMGSYVKVKMFVGTRKERWKEFKAFLRDEHFDIIFSYLTAANAYACYGAPKGTKVVTGIRNARLPFAKHIADAWLTNVKSACAVSNCQSGKDYFCKRGFRKKKVEVIANCIENAGEITPSPDKSKETVTVITVGRFVTQKDYPTAIKAFAKAYRSNPSLRLMIVGYGEQEQEVRNLVVAENIADATEIALNPPDITNRLTRSHIYLSTSLFEGVSNSILEGMNASLPVVATNVGDNFKLVDDGVNGYLTAIGDVDALAGHIARLAGDTALREKMGAASLQKVINEFSPSIFIRNYNQLIDKLLS